MFFTTFLLLTCSPPLKVCAFAFLGGASVLERTYACVLLNRTEQTALLLWICGVDVL